MASHEIALRLPNIDEDGIPVKNADGQTVAKPAVIPQQRKLFDRKGKRPILAHSSYAKFKKCNGDKACIDQILWKSIMKYIMINKYRPKE
ncbi:maker659 [Drosophila busckii]|uniref:Maker659 n=2 Tax=Drosophila busckii TaxID=30019 RepID=A0A0M5J5L6_DROBS|nr:maker659 [Drosophila busckii]